MTITTLRSESNKKSYREDEMKEQKGYIIVLTGNGKGKTTCALGMAMRAAGQGLKVAMLQFLKGSWKYGELDTAMKLAPHLSIRPLGEGFIHVNPEDPDPKDLLCAEGAWKVCKEALSSGDHDMVILDEVNNAIAYGLLSADDVVVALQKRPYGVHAILTGRDAHPRILEMADLVTEMMEVKHPYRSGTVARKGIEY
ncbi:MAG: cob(I)yrinic acid a,c-diamide adenosyltransferase [Syntrophus sp. (in: bacteria)]|nr:cob(I)yrinic acid a,c-diamide adenosyltransferase [Syntrophus sp. (in: bacteria)]